MDLVDELRKVCLCTVSQPCPSYLDKIWTFVHVCDQTGRIEDESLDEGQRACDPQEVEAPRKSQLEEKGSPRLRPSRGRSRGRELFEKRIPDEGRSPARPDGRPKGGTSLSLKECEQQATAVQSGAY